MSPAMLDARNLLCPLPVIRTQDAVTRLQPGDELQVVSTDPGVLHDIPAWCRVHGHRVGTVEEDEQSGEITITIRVGNTG